MKQKDILTIVVIAILAGVVSFLVASRVFVTPENRQQKAAVIDPINPEMDLPPDERFFNKNSINPTRNSSLDATNDTPFNGASQ